MNEQLEAIQESARLFLGGGAALEPCGRGNVNTACFVKHGGQTYLIKTETRADIPDFYSGQIERDMEGARLLAEHGLPAPKVLFHGRNSLGQSYVISTVLKGRMVSDLWPGCSREEKRGIKEDILKILRALGGITATHFGAICGGGKLRSYKTWGEAYLGLVSTALGDCLRFGSLTEPEAALISSAAAINSGRFSYEGKPSFCHMDLHWYNVMAENGRVTGIIDFGNALYAPVYSDIFRLDGAFLYGNGPFFEGGRAPLTLDRHEAFSADLLNRLDYYVFLSMSGRAEPARPGLLSICRQYLENG